MYLDVMNKYFYYFLGIVLAYTAIFFCWAVWYKRKVKVNCWFCGNDDFVPRKCKSWWLCLSCDQYNGFKNNGDYFNEIPEMFETSTNQPKFCVTPSEKPKLTNLLCSSCSQNQNYIIQGLADFSPSDDRYFDEELEEYKRELNATWKLCLSCRTAVSYHLQHQNQDIKSSHFNTENPPSIEKAPRRLNMKLGSPNGIILCIYEFIHIFSFLAGIWLYRQRAPPHASSTTDFILITTSLVFSAGTFLISLHTNKYHLVGISVSIMWLLQLIYGNFGTKDSRDLRSITFTALVTLEGLYLIHGLALLTIKLWKSITYKKERKKKVQNIRNSPKWQHVDRGSVIANVNKASLSKGLASCTNNNGAMLPKSNKLNIKSVTHNPGTPDILEGHLDAMYIQKTNQQDNSPAKDLKNTNHVVAALKYRATSHPEHRFSGQPLLRPATFLISSHDNMVSHRDITLNTHNRDVKFNIFPNEIREKINETDYGIQGKQNKVIIKEDKKVELAELNNSVVKEFAESNNNKVKTSGILTWRKVMVFVFIFSIICNVLLAYKLSSLNT